MTISVPGKLGEVSHVLEMSGAGGFAWYQTLLGLSKSAPARDYFGQILDADGTVLLCFHQWGTHRYPPLTRPDPPPINGLLLLFRVDDFDEALPRARALVSRLHEEPHRNPNTATMELDRGIRKTSDYSPERSLSYEGDLRRPPQASLVPHRRNGRLSKTPA